MSDHSGLQYLFDQPNLNGRKAQWLAMISEFECEIMYIIGKKNRVADALSRWIQVNHIAAMSSYKTYLQDRILQAGAHDVRYMEIMHRSQKGIGTGTSTCVSIGTGSGTDIGGSTSTGTDRCTGAGAQGMDYCLTVDGLLRFKDMIYVSQSNELKKVILREFHVKPY